MDYKVEVGNLSGAVREAEKIVAGKVAIDIGSPGQLDEETWDAMTVGTPPVQGFLEFVRIEDEDTETSYHEEDLPVILPFGVNVTARVGFNNSGVYVAAFTCTVAFIDPENIPRGTVTESVPLTPGAGSTVDTTIVTLDKPGTWKVHAILEG